MTKQLQTAMAAVLIFSAASMHGQLTTTTQTTKVAPGETKTTVTTKEKPAHKASSKSKKKVIEKKHEETATERQLRELTAQMAAQQIQIDALTQQNAAKDVALSTAQSTATTAGSQAAAASAQAQSATAAAQSQAEAVTGLKSTVTDLQNSNVGLATTISATKTELNDKIDSPAAIHYKGITITPVAFFALEGVWRQHSVNSDINTPFNSIPFPSANEGHVSELNFSGRQSRLGGLFEGNAGAYKLSGYFETDFLGTGTSSNNNQSNSYVLRQRQIWGKAGTKGGFAITGGQMWSLVTEDGVSTNNRTEKLPNTVDPQYMVGFSWTRQPGIRLQQRFGDVKKAAFTMAMSVEQAQITSFTANGTNPASYFFGGPGQNGGLYNAAGNIGAGNTASTGGITTYANNLAPDVVVKGALDFSKAHFELGGISRFLRDFYNPVTWGGTVAAPTFAYDTTHLYSNTRTAGGVFGSARVSMGKIVDVAAQGMAGTGVGRYGSSQLADATLRPDETLEPLKNYHGMLSLETHPAPKLDVYFYYGGEYAQRTVYTSPIGTLIGYGPRNLNDAGCYNLPSSPVQGGGSAGSIAATTCGSPTRYIEEAMGGLTYRIVNSPKYGRLQYQVTYSYLQRNLWSGVNVPATGAITTPTGPRATDAMVHIGMRYYIP